MELNEKKIISILPMDEAIRAKLLEEFDSYDEVKKTAVSKLLWDTYDLLYEFKLQQNLQLAMMKAQKNEETLDEDFYARVHEKTESEMTKESLISGEGNELEHIRSKLQTLAQG